MEEHIQRLREFLTRKRLSSVEVRDGMVSAYVAISRLNQLQGNPDVGLKQDEKGLLAHISGFMGAVFWERGFNYDAPSLENLSEIKMMLDGMVQVYAMPDNLQQALNEMCDVLLARGKGEPALVPPAVMDLLQAQGDESIAMPEASAAPEPRTSEPDLDRMPDEPTAAPAAEEPDFAAIFGEEPAFAKKAAPAPELEPVVESAPDEPAPEPEPVLDSAPDEPSPEPEVPSTQVQGAGVLDALEFERLEVAPYRPDEAFPAERAVPAGVEPAPTTPKKRTSRKKVAPAEGAAGTSGETGEAAPAPKPPRKRSTKAKTPPAEVIVPDDFMRLEPEKSAAAAEGRWGGRFESETRPAPPPVPEPESFFRTPSEPAVAPPPEAAVPAAAGSLQSAPEPKYQVMLDLPPVSAPEPERAPAKVSGGAFFLGMLLGIVLGASGIGAYYFFAVRPQAEQKAKELTRRTEELQTQLSAVTTEKEKLQSAMNEEAKKPPAQPGFYKVKAGAMLYWPEAGRKYILYRAKGAKGELNKVQGEPLERNLLLLRPERGTWRYAVSALDKDGKETEKSEVLTFKFPLSQ